MKQFFYNNAVPFVLLTHTTFVVTVCITAITQ